MTAALCDLTASHEDTIYRGCSFALDEIEEAARVLDASIKTLRENFDARHMVETKLAAEQCIKVANQIHVLSKTLANVFAGHLQRRSRI